ncbi:MAG: diguanylate cyclase [Paraglaciecola psychrophila]|jgi:diguanylate cyclase
MNYPEDAELAASYLKQAVPKIVGNKIPANPINYTLWYNYVAGKNPALNEKLDHIIAHTGTCSREQSEELYSYFIIGEYLEDHNKSLQNLTALASQLIDHMGSAIDGSSNFDSQLADSMGQLKTATSADNVAEVIENTLAATQSIRDSNSQFSLQLETANSEILALRSQLQDVEKQAFTDQLTQLYNRHAFDVQLKQLLAVDVAAENVCLIIADLDHFKKFNDEHGHVIGDRVLTRMGELIQDYCPDNATGARYGGEEFAIIVSNANEQEAAAMAETLRERLLKLRVRLKNSDKVLDNITASFGVTRYRLGESVENFIDRADKMLYRAKKAGRNRVEVEVLD